MANNRDDLDRENETTEENADRGMPSISKNRKSGGGGGIGQKIVVGFIAILVVLALIAVNGGFKGEEKEAPPKLDSNSGVANRLGPPPTLPPPPAPPAEEKPNENRMLNTGQIAPPPPSSATANRSNGQHEQTPEERKRTKSLLAFGNMSKPPQQTDGQQQPVQMTGQKSDSNGSLAESDRADSLGNNLKGTEVSGSRASLLVDRSYFITQGAFLNCALETAISSDVPGMTACRLTEDVYSTDKKVLLLERGSKIVGQYQGGMKRGQARIFVLWTRIETPKGVIVKLDSPGTDSLGRSGLDGFIDTHFWERFGSAIMLSTIDDAGTYLANKASGNGSNGNQFNFGGTADTARDTAGIALENDINIPPTLVKNQGDAISIFVARDLDFRGVYDLKAAY